MSYEAEGGYRSPIIGDLTLPPPGASTPDPDARVAMLVELNVLFPGGLGAVREAFYATWREFSDRNGLAPSAPAVTEGPTQPPVPANLELIAPKLYQCVLTRRQLRELVDDDQRLARANERRPPTIFRVWPDYTLEPQIDRSAPTVKADAAWRSYEARGAGIVWAVIDSGIDGCHPHFAGLELAREARGDEPPTGLSTGLHADFSHLVRPELPFRDGEYAGPNGPVPPQALRDRSGHGTHVGGIIAGRLRDQDPIVAITREPGDSGFVRRERVGALSGMAPDCQLVSLKVMRKTDQGTWITSSAAVIRALTYLRTEVNVDPAVLRVHGVNMSLGCEWHPEQYAAGQSPLCQALNQLVMSGVVVVVSAGNFGARTTSGDSANTSAVLGSITEPAHAEECVAVGSTHRDAPHAFGVTWTSGKGPTLDGRMKPDVVAPGEWISSAATGEVRNTAGLDPQDGKPTYAEQSGTSMAAPHVSGVVAAFLSARPEFVGRPRQVKQLLMNSATDLGRERYAQGAGLVDLMRMLSNV
ncbi:S8 family peptidase [Actinophytocola oryzae]|uniref:Subtilase family protein n=1 Tax=Actinophytocola oryzae TaxID=502181 RepID=A0A4R7VXS2_9PSEU|nr:S8 family peptidase [Actinophytocola oryzae]TDV54844.1 subtilase family protein [Actinophytocola oryzae]